MKKGWHELSRRDWQSTINDDETIEERHFERVKIGALQRIATALEAISRRMVEVQSDANMALVFARSAFDNAIGALPDNPAVVKAAREKASRERAMAAYVAACKRAGTDPGIATVADMGFSVRVRTAIARIGITTVEQLAALTEQQLLVQKNFGVSSLMEVKEKLAAIGLKLAEE